MAKNMLVVVDYQNDFVDGVLGFDTAKNLDGGITRQIRKALANGDTVVCTYDTHDPAYLDTREGKHLPVPHCIYGTEGWELYGETRSVVEENKDKVIVLRKKDCFGVDPRQMLDALPDEEPEIITFVGVVTNMCVISNVCTFQARYPNAQIRVLTDLVDSFDPARHIEAIKVMKSMQVEAVTSDAA